MQNPSQSLFCVKIAVIFCYQNVTADEAFVGGTIPRSLDSRIPRSPAISRGKDWKQSLIDPPQGAP
jgi:hypothetical protein